MLSLAKPVVTAGVDKAPEDAVFITCGVGGRDLWAHNLLTFDVFDHWINMITLSVLIPLSKLVIFGKQIYV